MATKFFYCPVCGNVVVKVVDSGVTPFCCGKEMIELEPETSEGDGEKHIPVVTCRPTGKVHVAVGSKPHPMIPEHYIMAIILETDKGLHIRHLKPGQTPEAQLDVEGEKLIAAYEFCNVHGLWKTAAAANSCCMNSNC